MFLLKMENTLNLENYKRKPQSYIKHTLLRAYLKRLFMIIGQRERVIRYVDCFAGPWQDESDDLRDTSIAISLDIMKECRESLSQRGKGIKFKALYIEKTKKSFEKLQSFLKDNLYDGIEAESLNGDFFTLHEDILRWCGRDDFTFFFIDPTGWKDVVEIETLYPLLKRIRSEFLINFMFDFLLRAHSQTLFREHMKRIFSMVPDTTGMSPKQREDYLLKKYIDELRASLAWTGKKARVAYVKILDPFKDRTKYDLVYLTRHPLGIIVFMEESENIDIVQKKVRAHAQQGRRIDKSGQQELFAPNISGDESEGVDPADVKKYWLNILSFEPKMFGNEQLADMLEETGWFISDFQKAFNELVSEGKVVNVDATRKRPVKAVHFAENEHLKKL